MDKTEANGSNPNVQVPNVAPTHGPDGEQARGFLSSALHVLVIDSLTSVKPRRTKNDVDARRKSAMRSSRLLGLRLTRTVFKRAAHRRANLPLCTSNSDDILHITD